MSAATVAKGLTTDPAIEDRILRLLDGYSDDLVEIVHQRVDEYQTAAGRTFEGDELVRNVARAIDNLARPPDTKQSTTWEEATPLNTATTPDFPANYLPAPFGEWVTAVEQSIQVPAALVAMLDIGIVGAACAKKVVVRMSESHSVPINVWTLTALDSGERKSSTFREALSPVRAWQERETGARRGEVAEYQARVRMAKKALTKAEGAAGADWSSVEAQEAKRLARELAELEAHPVVAPKLVVADATPEAVLKLVSAHGHILIASPKGIVFDQMSGRYSDGGMPNLDIFLMGYSGDDYDSERIGRGSVTAKKPAISMTLTTQPEVLSGLGQRKGFDGRGVLSRLWYSLPTSLVGHRKEGDPSPIDPAIRAQRDDRIMQLLDIRVPEQPNTLILSYGALKMLHEHAEMNERRLLPGGELHHMKPWGTRVPGGTARLCGILHMMEYATELQPWTIQIKERTALAAVAIMEQFLVPHAMAAYASMRVAPNAKLAREIVDWLRRNRRLRFNRRDLHHDMRRRVDRPSDWDAPLALLVDYGWLREVPVEQKAGRARTNEYDVNPALLVEGGAR